MMEASGKKVIFANFGYNNRQKLEASRGRIEVVLVGGVVCANPTNRVATTLSECTTNKIINRVST